MPSVLTTRGIGTVPGSAPADAPSALPPRRHRIAASPSLWEQILTPWLSTGGTHDLLDSRPNMGRPPLPEYVTTREGKWHE